MWNKKKSVAPRAANSVPTNLQTNQPTKLAPSFGEGTTKRNKDVMRPTGAMVERATSRLGSNLHLKGEISGNEDLHIDGTLEGLVQMAERKLTEGATAKADSRHNGARSDCLWKREGERAWEGQDRDQERRSVNGDLITAQIVIEERSILQGLDRDREERGKGSGHKRFLREGFHTDCADNGRGAEEYRLWSRRCFMTLTTKHDLTMPFNSGSDVEARLRDPCAAP
jgi:cytoskeletal protein CcmA (bactofilin family)